MSAPNPIGGQSPSFDFLNAQPLGACAVDPNFNEPLAHDDSLGRESPGTIPNPEPPSEEPTPEPTLSLVPERPRATFQLLSDVIQTEIDWLWPGFLAIGKPTLMFGDPGVGKSFLSLDLAARVTTGQAWPDGSPSERGPGSVLLISAEDDAGDTICPRVRAAGGDMTRIVIFRDALDDEGKSECFNLKKHVPHLEWTIRQQGDIKLIVIDPLTAFGGGVDERNQGAVRAMLQPLIEMAVRVGSALLVISHPNKNEGGKAAYRASGSLAYSAVARFVFLVVKDASDGTRRLLLPVKINLAEDRKGLAYRIVDGKLEWEPDPVLITADEAMTAETKARQQPSQLNAAVSFLNELLAKGAVRKELVIERGESIGLSERTLARAKKEASIGSTRLNTDQVMRWFWHLPGMKPSSLADCQFEELESGPAGECRDSPSTEPGPLDMENESQDGSENDYFSDEEECPI